MGKVQVVPLVVGLVGLALLLSLVVDIVVRPFSEEAPVSVWTGLAGYTPPVSMADYASRIMRVVPSRSSYDWGTIPSGVSP